MTFRGTAGAAASTAKPVGKDVGLQRRTASGRTTVYRVLLPGAVGWFRGPSGTARVAAG